jgi:hypothetical protein
MLPYILALFLAVGCATPAAAPEKTPDWNGFQETDAEIIDRIHTIGPNWKWEPEWVEDRHQGQRTHLVVLSDEEMLAVCGENVAACTIAKVPAELVPWINADEIARGHGEEYFVEAGSCVIFMPQRRAEFPRTWFYLLGHEFAHCRYGQYHPDDVLPDDDV